MAHQITEKDGIFTVKDKAWHGLGVTLPEAPSISQAIVAAKLDWQVKTEPLYTRGGEVVDAQATRREDTGDILGVVGLNYTPLQNVEAFDTFAPLVDNGFVELETAGSLRDGRKVWILAKIKDISEQSVRHPSDSIRAYVLLSNAHDGLNAVRLGFTNTRVVCANTLAVAMRDKASKLIRVKHTSKVKENVDALRDVMNVAKTNFEASLEQYRFLASKQINAQDLEKYVRTVFNLPSAEEQGRYPKPLAEAIKTFESEVSVAGDTYWNAYNAVQGFMQHSQGKTADVRLDKLWFGPNFALNESALATAVEMASVA